MKSKQLAGQKGLILIENLYEDAEFIYPRYRLIEEGLEMIVAGPQSKETYLSKHGYPCKAEIAFQDVKVDDYQILIIPGGYAPDKLRRHSSALDVVRQFHKKNK